MSKDLTTTDMNASARFTNKVISMFGTSAGAIELTEYQKQLIQGYFIGIDKALKTTEENRISRNSWADEKNDLPATWANINLQDLAMDVVHYARMGLDMMQPNFISPVLFKTKKGVYNATMIVGYNGKRYIAEKYALDKPIAVTVELVHATDKFTPHKKGRDNPIESYSLEITNPFDRGAIVGGFGYIEFSDHLKNKLIIMSIAEIEKRKPRYASTEFWGGKKKEKGKEVEVEGWYKEMCLKTVIREVFNNKNIPIDPKKIDDSYHFMKRRETEYAEAEADAEAQEYGNAIVIDTTPELAAIDAETGEITDNAETEAEVEAEFDDLP